MGLHDTFDFDEPAYIAKTAARTTPQLQEEEIKKLRQHFAASCSIGAGLGHSIHSAGISLGVSAFGVRRLVVAKRKLAIIRDELARRGVAPHDPTKRDAAIPVAAALAGMGLGAEIGHLVGGLLPTPGLPPGTHLDQAGCVVGDAAGAAEGFVHGVTDQAGAVGHAVQSEVAGVLAGHGAEVAAGQAAGDGHAVGYVAGILAAKKTEEFIAECVGEAVLAYALEKLLDPEIKVELALQGKYCPSCNESKDGYDLCEECYASGNTCETPDSHRLYVYLKANVPKNVGPYAYISVDSVSCATCANQVQQGPYYHCPGCRDFVMCERCYEMGRACRNRDAGHVLDRYYVFSGMYSVSGNFNEKHCQFCNGSLGHSGDSFYPLVTQKEQGVK
ncbi:hypothetical protein SLS56_008324 [Neofusicoccum ribis]|uniref:ZZ-type domain-containing protein n=1 Tax=Neofusicoccum ribis TaxID=45134 RepID=A0ABR3SKF1_9PEZI